MNSCAAIQILPNMATVEETIKIVDEVISYIKSTGQSYYVGPFETTIEGDYEDIMEVLKNCHYIAKNAGSKKVSSYIKIIYMPEGDVLSIDEKITKHHS